MTLKSDGNSGRKLTLGSKNGKRNLVNFNMSSGKSENLHFNVLLLSVAYKVSAKKYGRINFHDTEKRNETLKKKL